MIYRLSGLTCSDCAARFAEDVQRLPGVKTAQVDFGSARLTIDGTPDGALLQRVAREHDIRLFDPDSELAEPATLSQRERLTGTSFALLVSAWTAPYIAAAFTLDLHPLWVPGLLVLAMLSGGVFTFRKGLRSLMRLRFDMNALMTIAVGGALLLGEWWEAAVVAFLFGLGETLESRSLEKARASIKELISAAPKRATVRYPDGDRVVPIDTVEVGDRLLIRPGERIPVDGHVAVGASTVNEAPVTGESIPVDKRTGDRLYAGSLNEHGALEMIAEKRAEHSTWARIIHMVEEAQSTRAPAQSFIDRFAAVYTPGVLVAALLIAFVAPIASGEPWHPWLYRALTLLVVACPCALVVSTPVALVSAIGAAARHGVLIKGGAHLEAIGSIKAVAFDKTGTLTTGRPVVKDSWATPRLAAEQLLALAASLEGPSEHPLAKAVVERARAEGMTPQPIAHFQALPGLGAAGFVEGRWVWIGNRRLFSGESAKQPRGEYQRGKHQRGISPATAQGTVDPGYAERSEKLAPPPPSLSAQEMTQAAHIIGAWENEGWAVMIVADQGGLLGALALADQLRPEASQALAELKQTGIGTTVLLSGDHRASVASVAQQVGIDEWQAELLPEQKVAAVNALRQKHGRVAMVGDGINDAPALAAASVGTAMGAAGSDAALETADIVLMGDNLRRVPFVVRLSRQTLRVIKQNIGFSLLTKIVALLLIIPGWLTLWMAILADMGATIVVSLNGARLLLAKPGAQQFVTRKGAHVRATSL